MSSPVTYLLAAAAWYLLGTLGLSTEQPGGVVWLQAGLGVAILMQHGRSAWPAILGVSLLVHFSDTGAWLPSAVLAATDLAQALLAAVLIERAAGGRAAWFGTDTLVRASAVAACVTGAAALVTTAVLLYGAALRADDFATVWAMRWTGQLASVLVITPVALLAFSRSFRRDDWALGRESAAMLATTALVAAVVFTRLPGPDAAMPLQVLAVPVLLWAALRFGPGEVAMAAALLLAGASLGTAAGVGPYANAVTHLAMLDVYVPAAGLAATTLVLSTVAEERRAAHAKLEQLATSDALTGLANYRRLLSVLRAEITRSRRTRRPFALVIFDVDGLKAINDRYGHVVGNRSLCRVGETLTRSCRAIDTTARFGGDEFAVVLPESGVEGGVRVAERVVAALASQPAPEVRVTSGTAVFPGDGDSPTMLMRAADQALARARARRAVTSTAPDDADATPAATREAAG